MIKAEIINASGEVILEGVFNDLSTANTWIDARFNNVKMGPKTDYTITTTDVTVEEGSKPLKSSRDVDIYDELFTVFRTKDSATATANYETWKDMKVTPSRYSSLGLKVDHQVNAADNTEIFSPGSALDTDQKIVDYATRKVEQAQEYGAWRMQRIQQYKDAKDAL